MEAFNFAESSRYLFEQHGLTYSGDQLVRLRQERDATSLEFGPTPNADGTFSAAALDAFADALKRARSEQEGLANAEPTRAS